MKRLILVASAAILATLTATSVKAANIALWTFETTSNSITGSSATLGPLAADSGSGSANGVHASAASVWSHPAGNGSPSSFNVNTWTSGDYFQFQVSTVGFTGIGVSFDQTGSSTGPRDFSLRYSTDGSAGTLFASYTVLLSGGPAAAWNGATGSSAYSYFFNLSSISAIDNQSTVFFRLVNTSTTSIGGGTVGTAGTDRVDNFLVMSPPVAPVPEPATVVLASLGGLVVLMAIRRRR